MKILIIDQDVISSSKLKLVLSKYGECEIASNGKDSVEMFKKSQEMSDPYGFISMEADLKDMPGKEILEKIRKWESERQIKKDQQAKILMILSGSEGEGEEPGTPIDDKETVYLVKPYDRKKLENLLAQLGMEKSPIELGKKETPAPEPVRVVKPGEKVNKPDSKDVEIALKKITTYINNAEQFKGADAPKILSDLVKAGGEEAELLVAQYMTSDKIPANVRQELICAAGYILSPHFLVVLNKILNSEDNIKTIQEAVVAVAKFSNQRALNILNQAMVKFKNPMLLNTLRGEIARIKKDKPILAILPRFLQSYNNPKNFKVTLDILKKIVTPEESQLFLNYLKSGNDVLEDGTFEILCHAGDISIKNSIINFFEDRIQQISCIGEPECNDLYILVSNLNLYLQKNISMVEELVNEMKDLFSKIKDIRVKQIIVSILTKSRRTEALEFIKSIYNDEKDLHEDIIEQLSGNQQAVDFLFEKYHQGQVLKEKVIDSLLKSEQGLQYFIKNFFTFETDKQEFILKHITFSSQDYLLEFINKIYQSNLYGLKFQLLRILKNNYLFDFKNTLFDENHQREFMFMGNDYLDTIIELFPITSLRMFFDKITDEEISNSKVIKYLSKIASVAPYEPVIPFNDAKFINRLFNRILNANNMELNIQFFLALENVKFLDIKSYKYLLDATNAFAEVRGENINSKEVGAITRIKARLREQLQDIREIEALQNDLKTLFISLPIDVEKLDKVFETNQKAIGLKIHHVVAFLADQFKTAYIGDEKQLDAFFAKYPLIDKFIKYLVAHKEEIILEDDWTDNSKRMILMSHFKDDLRIVLSFKEKRKSALIMDQILGVLPEFQVLLDSEQLKESDMLLCDHIALKEYIEKRTLKTSRIFLYLENRLDFAQFRSYNPRVFMKPVSGYRIIRMLLQELYIKK